VAGRALPQLFRRASCATLLGGAPMTSEIARKVIHAIQKPAAPARVKVELFQREQEILERLSQGFANKQIADKCDISYQTVKVQ
jgi:DNA-binding NarL/FixJ family response regulator